MNSTVSYDYVMMLLEKLQNDAIENDDYYSRIIDIVKCKETPNKIGKLIMPDGTGYTPVTLWRIVLSNNDWDLCMRMPIMAATVTEFVATVYNNKLYYLDVDQYFDVFGDMWDLGSNYDPDSDDQCSLQTWNIYHVPDMSTFNGKVLPIVASSDCVHAYSHKKWKRMVV